MAAKLLKNSLVFVLAVGMVVLVTTLCLMPPDDLPHVGGWFSQLPYVDKIVHFCFYFGMITVIRFAKTYTSGYAKSCSWKLLVFAALYGGLIEILQGKYFGRGCDIWDEVANVLGAMAAIWLIPQRWHERLADRFGRHKPDPEHP